MKGLGDNSTETRVSFDDFLMVVVIPDDSSKCHTYVWILFDHFMNFDHNLIINQLLFYEVYQLFVAPRAKDQSNFDLV